MKKLIVIILVIALFTNINAQQVSPENNKQAKDILDKVTVKTKTYSTIFAKFNFTLINKQDDVKETQKGILNLKGNSYLLEMMGAITYSDGKTRWTYMKDAEEVTITNPDEDEESILNPATIFTIYEKGFKYKFVGDVFKHNRALYEIDIFPEDREKSYSRIKFQIDKTKMQIYSIQYIGKDGINYLIEIKEFTPNIKMDDKMFTFDKTKYPEVEINDMR